MFSTSGAVLAALAAASSVSAINLDTSDANSLSSVASDLAASVVEMYLQSTNKSGIPGVLSQPYYWWEGGMVLDSLIHYRAATGDDQYDDMITNDLLFQVGPDNDYAPPNQTKSLGNSDQAAWAFAALSAAELDFPAHASSSVPTWAQLADNVFKAQAARWDAATCDGGLRWQIFQFNAGYSYKNSQSNAGFFALAARLAALNTNDASTYTDNAQKAYAWMRDVLLIDNSGNVYDGTSVSDNCSRISKQQWTYDAGLAMLGAVAMYNTTATSSWSDNTDAILTRSLQLFAADSNIITEAACESVSTCSTDQFTFKGGFARDLGVIALRQPNTAAKIVPVLTASAQAAAAACKGSKAQGFACSQQWSGNGGGASGLGQTMSALDVVVAAMTAMGESKISQVQAGSSSTSPTSTSSTGPVVGSNGTLSNPSSPPSPAQTTGAASRVSVGVLGGLAIAAVGAAANLL